MKNCINLYAHCINTILEEIEREREMDSVSDREPKGTVF